MAKQTFTTGQVLTAAQMTSLQQTAMGGGSTTAKSTSYVLVAADAGTVVQMNAAGSTTITVNTALFSAGDTVQIQNVGAGVCTITAGTATVSTSATLILKQYDAGTLYFNSTSAAIFFASDAADSPLTTKGDLYTYSTTNDRLAVGTNGQTLVANSSTASGLEWQTPASGWTSIASGTLSGASVSLTSIPSTYKNLTIYLNNPYASTTADFRVTINSDTSASYNYWSWNPSFTTSSGGSDNFVRLGAAGSLITANNNYGSGFIEFPNYYSTTAIKVGRVMYQGSSGACYGGYWNCIQSYVPAAISSIQLKTSTGTFSGGTYELWGQK